MVKLLFRFHPDVLFSYSSSYVELILHIENEGKDPTWLEADINVPENLSLAPNAPLRRGRVKVGILAKKEFIEKAVRIFGTSITSPQVYRINSTLYVYNKDAIIETRMEKGVDLRCELKKDASI